MKPMSVNNDAVSTVVSAILILAVITTFITAINAYYIPSLAAEHEIKHMQEVHSSFTELAAKTGSDCSNAKVFIPLGDGGLPLMSSLSSSGTLTIEPEYGWVNVSLTGIHDAEKVVNGHTTIINITTVSDLIFTMKYMEAGNYTVKINNDNNNKTSIYIRSSNNKKVVVETTDNGSLSSHDVFKDWVMGDYFSMDVLNPAYGFSNMLDNAPQPFSLTFEGPYYIKYDCTEDYMNMSTGYFKYRASNNFWIDQELVYENGAVILKQGPDSIIRSLPFMTDDGTELDLCIFDIIGGKKKSVSGNGASTVNIKVENSSEYRYGNVQNTTVTITSKSPQAWETHLLGMTNIVSRNNNTVIAWINNKEVIITTSNIKIDIP
ncbi:DUF7289 family protein [Methanococcoides sp.]|uniref:DUF7289 family protein n=1 Tax=Methanococcoides sp. TaxID=1966350 RepID=UPI00272E3F0A|nr:hypothetical protein [Methanococcoides sp.]